METHPLSRRQQWALVLAATFTMTISYVDRQTLAVLAPRVTADLHIDDTGFGFLIAAFSLAYLVGAPLSGLWIDRIGARKGLLIAVVAWTIVAALHMLAPGFAVLFALRIALGFAESPSFPGASQAVQRALPEADRARGLGFLFTGSSIGAMVAPPLATWLMARYSWRAAFLGTALAGLVWVPVWLTFAWSRGGRLALDRRPAWPVLRAPDATSTQEPAFRGVQAPEHYEHPPIWRHPAMLRAVVLILASAPAMAFVLLWSSKFLVRTYGMAPVDVGRYLWLPPLVYDLGSIAFGDQSARRAKRRRYDGSPDRAFVALAAVMCACVALLSRAPEVGTAMAVMAVTMAGGAGLYALLTNDLMSRIPEGALSTAGGLCATAQSLAYIIANPLVGRVAQTDGDYRRVAVAVGLWVLPGALVWLLWKPPPARAVAAR